MQRFQGLRADITAERQSLDKRRAHFQLPKIRGDDYVSAVEQVEIRSWLRSLPIGERIKHAASDPTIAAAVVHSPPVLSGLNDDGHTRAKNFLIQHLFGKELAVIDQEREIVENVAKAIDVAELEALNAFEHGADADFTARKRDILSRGEG
jgi:hypothetical protein